MLGRIVLIIIFVFMNFVLYSLELNFDSNKDGMPDRWIEIELDKDWDKFDLNKYTQNGASNKSHVQCDFVAMGKLIDDYDTII